MTIQRDEREIPLSLSQYSCVCRLCLNCLANSFHSNKKKKKKKKTLGNDMQRRRRRRRRRELTSLISMIRMEM